MSIKLLSEDVILKIAAGEVIERPASVIKELLENSLDAKAAAITISTEKDSLSILDNGIGMSQNDLNLSYIRHATSKISTDEDLFDIHSLGFRGEALASIAAVSLLEITSKQAGSDVAYKIILEGGKKISESPSPFPYDSGTQIVVKNLFFNTPARKKYLTSEKNEQRLILDIVNQYSLTTDVVFKFIHDGKTVLNSPKGNLKERFFSVFGNDAKDMRDLSSIQSEGFDQANQQFVSQGISLLGLISIPKLYRKSRSSQYIFVNGRLIKNSTIYAAIAQSYKGYLNTGEHPFVVLQITIDPKRIDVNVHPTKQEIKFDNDSLLFKSVYHILHEALLALDLTRTVTFEELPQAKELQKELVAEIQKEENLGQTTPSLKFPKENVRQVSHFTDQLVLEDARPALQSTQTSFVENKNDEFLKVLSIYNKEFILAENISSKKLAIIDFHAAAEIVNYERLTQKYADTGVDTQNLLSAEVLDLPSSDVLLLDEHKEIFSKCGFDIAMFGETSIQIRSIPTLFGRTFDELLFLQILDDIKLGKKKTAIDDLKDTIITRMSCRASEKAGDNLTLAQAEKIVRDLFSLFGNSYNCPHGRPTVIELSHEDLEKMFKRIR